jgi:tetratricopeptide (TPR) repeat protein
MVTNMKKQLISIGLMGLIISALTGCNSAGKYNGDGKKYFAQGQYEEAADHFLKAIDKNPNRMDYYIDYGINLIALGNYEEAIAQFDQAYRDKDVKVIKQNNKKLFRGKGIAYYYSKQYEKALEQFDLALEINELSDLNVDILYYKGNTLMAIGSYDLAAEIYSNILSKDEKDVSALLERAYCYQVLGAYENALEDYNKVISLDPNNYDGYFGKFSLLLEYGMNTEAAEVLAQAGAIEGDRPGDQYNKAKLHYYQGNFDTAIVELEESYLNGFAEANFYIGEIYREKKEYQKAAYYYEMFITEGMLPGPYVYNQLGYCFIKLGDYSKAITYLEKGIAMNHLGAKKALMKNEIIAYEGLGEFETAFEKMQEYIALYPDDAEALRENTFLKTRIISNESNEDEER